MFGYIRPIRNELDNYLFKSQYCGLCKALGRKYGQFSRLFLSYDVSLLTLILHALSGNKFTYKYESCIMHMINKRRVKIANEIDYMAADISVYFAKKKIEDNIKDERLIKKTFFRFFNKIPIKWNQETKFKHDELDEFFNQMENMEEFKKPDVDKISNCFGHILETTTHNAAEKLSIELPDRFEKFSFFLGKLIYTLDAFEDLGKDLKKWRYNPLIFENKEIILSGGSAEEIQKRINDKEKWRVYLLLDHIDYIYSFFKNNLGVYRTEIDGIISKSLPTMVFKVIGESSTCQKKEIFHE